MNTKLYNAPLTKYIRRSSNVLGGVFNTPDTGYARIVGINTKEQVERIKEKHDILKSSPPLSHPNFSFSMRVYFCKERSH